MDKVIPTKASWCEYCLYKGNKDGKCTTCTQSLPSNYAPYTDKLPCPSPEED